MSQPSVVEYARYHELAADCRADDPLTHLSQSVEAAEDGGKLTEPNLPDCDDLLHDDKIQPTRVAADFLGECLKPPSKPDWSHILGSHNATSKWMMEPPMLVSDHEKDLEWFRKGVNLDKVLRDCAVNHDGVGYDFGDSADLLAEFDEHAKCMPKDLSNEHIQTSFETLKILAEYIRDEWTEQHQQEIVSQDLKAAKAWCIEAPTPLLTPQVFLEGHIPREVSPVKLEFDHASEIELDADDLLLQVERISKTEDQICTDDIEVRSPTKVREVLGISSTTPPIDFMHRTSGQLTDEQQKQEEDDCHKADRLKIEVPWIPSPPDSAEKKQKHVTFKEIFEEYIGYPSQSQSTSSQVKKEAEVINAYTTRLEQYGDDLKRTIMYEKLGINHKTLREEVLKLQFPEIGDPRTRAVASTRVVDALKAALVDRASTSVAEEKALNWIPIPQRLMLVDLREQIEDKSLLEQYVQRPAKILRSEQLLYTEPQLQILTTGDKSNDELDTNIDIELADTTQLRPTPTQLQLHSEYDTETNTSNSPAQRALVPTRTVVKKPLETSVRLMLSLEHVQRSEQKSAVDPTTTKKRPRMQTDPDELPEPMFKSKSRKILTEPHRNEPSNICDSFYSAGSLASFLQLRGGRFKKPDLHASNVTKANETDRADELQTDPIMISQAQSRPGSPVRRPPLCSGSLRSPNEFVEVPSTPTGETITTSKLPLPEMHYLSEQRTIIINSALVSNRQLLTYLELHGRQDLVMIHRELCGDPDVVLNPTTCMIYTTVQALTQRCLPGQEQKNQHNTIQQRIQKLTAAFDWVFVLVIGPPCLDTSGSNNQMDVMTDFSSSCASIGAESTLFRVTPIWIPADSCLEGAPESESPQCRWTWALICKHAFSNRIKSDQGSLDLVFLQDETLWELFLRKAGMNPMAAQVVTSLLKRLDHSSHDLVEVGQHITGVPSVTSWGLRKFVSMSPEQRLEVFGDLVGRRAVEQIDHVLSQSE